ncbi:MAG: ABC transporter permease [Syntrophus sp. (in: bacteria)]|nr:ABC transporter permease [Syntrophus sp. (in: bacteria)]
MGKLWPNIYKELLLLFRDYAGLLVIFLMPVVLVIVTTLVQQNILKSIGETKIKTLFLDRDGQMVGPKLEEVLKKVDALELVKELKGKTIDVETAKSAVAKGDYQLAIIVPEGTTKAFIYNAKQAARNSLSSGDTKKTSKKKKTVTVPDLTVYFDPTVTETVRTSVTGSLEKALIGIETDEKIKAFAALLPLEIEAAAKKSMGAMWSEEVKKSLPVLSVAWDKTPIMAVRESTAQLGKHAKTPNTVQQNIPAWTLFGMFFIVVPLGGSLIRERQSGMLVRLLTMPMSCLTILTGKIVAYVLICMAQFGLIIAVGKFLLPLLGTPVLETGPSPVTLMIIALSAAVAACGYGILLGTMARTYEQASTFGAVSVVIAAAIGGIMVPVYVMPAMMQKISLFSPLAWGLNAFLDVFVRGGSLWSVLPDVMLLVLFFLVTTLIAWFNLSRKGRIRIQ